ncbi:hypothetical protein GCM10010429_03970 [Micromonospora olivasterospora]
MQRSGAPQSRAKGQLCEREECSGAEPRSRERKASSVSARSAAERSPAVASKGQLCEREECSGAEPRSRERKAGPVTGRLAADEGAAR